MVRLAVIDGLACKRSKRGPAQDSTANVERLSQLHKKTTILPLGVAGGARVDKKEPSYGKIDH